MFLSLYNIISNFLFSGDPSSAVYGELICEGFSAFCCVFLLAVPFIVVWRFIRAFL